MKRNHFARYFAASVMIAGYVAFPGRISAAYQRNVVCEEITGTWCMYCPSGIAAIEASVKEFGDRFIPIAVHYNDVMAIDDYADRLMSRIGQTGVPYAYTMRAQKYSGSVSDLNTRVDYLLLKQAEAKIELSAELIGDIIRVRTLVVSDNDMAEGDWGAELIVTENNVCHPDDPQYSQRNAYAGSEFPMGGFELQTDPIPASQIHYQDVARLCDVLSKDIAGIELSAGIEYTFEYEIAVPGNIDNPEQCFITGILLDRSGAVINAGRCPVKMAGNGIHAIEKPETELSGIYDLSGKRVSASYRGIAVEVLSNGERRKIVLSK